MKKRILSYILPLLLIPVFSSYSLASSVNEQNTFDKAVANISSPQIIPSSVKVNGRDISRIKSIPKNTVIEANIKDEYGSIRLPTVEVSVNDISYTVKTLRMKGALNMYHIICRPDLAASSGSYRIAIKATNMYGKTDFFENTKYKVFSGSVTTGPRNTPNPFSPKNKAEITTIIYALSEDKDIKIIISDITGGTVWQKSCKSGTEGGKTGENKLIWDGKDSSGRIVANGVYLYLITSDDKMLAKGQLSVVD